MKELNISPNFTVEDIHKIREYNYEMTKDMTKEDRRAYYRAGAERMKKRLEEHKRSKELK
jgi:precorrin-2 methylase